MNAHETKLQTTVVFAIALCCANALGQPPAAVDRVAGEAQFLGVKTCVQCHRTAVENAHTDQVQGHILLDEYTTWRYKDKHSLAYCVLESDLSRRMGELLGYDDVTKDKRCTNCHAPQHDRPHLDKAPHAADGVSCEACHGSAQDWYIPHQFPAWRGLAGEQKQDEFGMMNLHDPATRSALCISCHVGDRRQQRVVTHAMYAAGHPPLPSIEVGYFSDAMPRHWRYAHEKQGEAAAARREFERTKLVLVGGAVSLRAAADLIIDPAVDEHAWPELAQFDCAACHHDLKYPSWRQRRGYTGRPGRPTPRLSPLPLVRLSVRVTGSDDAALDATLSPVYAAFDARPFGDPPAIQAASQRLKKWSDNLVNALSTAEVDQSTTRSALRQLCEIAATETPDYDAARQIAWALQMMYADLHPDETSWHPQAAGLFEQLDSQLRLTFPSRATSAEMTDDSPRPTTDPDRMCPDVPIAGPITTTLPDALKAMSAYDPDKFRAAVAEFAALIESR